MLKQVFLFVFVGFVLLLLILFSCNAKLALPTAEFREDELDFTRLFRRRALLELLLFCIYWMVCKQKLRECTEKKSHCRWVSEEMMFVCFMWNIYKIFVRDWQDSASVSCFCVLSITFPQMMIWVSVYSFQCAIHKNMHIDFLGFLFNICFFFLLKKVRRKNRNIDMYKYVIYIVLDSTTSLLGKKYINMYI